MRASHARGEAEKPIAIELVGWMLVRGLIGWEAVKLAIALLPPFMLAAWIGGRMFRKSSEALYRRIVLALLFCAGLYGLFRS